MHGKAITVDCSPVRLVLGANTKTKHLGSNSMSGYFSSSHLKVFYLVSLVWFRPQDPHKLSPTFEGQKAKKVSSEGPLPQAQSLFLHYDTHTPTHMHTHTHTHTHAHAPTRPFLSSAVGRFVGSLFIQLLQLPPRTQAHPHAHTIAHTHTHTQFFSFFSL